MVKFPVESAWKFPTSYVAYDLETTGLHDPIWPVQYGAIRVIDGKPEEKFSTLVALPDGVEIEKGAIAVHGINPDMFIDAPSQREAYLAFSNFVGELPLLGFNSKAYDGPIIDRLADLYRMPHLTNNSGGSIKGQIDAMELYQKLFGNRKSKLSDVCEHYSVTNDHAHDAIGDVDATVRVYSKIIDDIRMNSTDPKDISVEQQQKLHAMYQLSKRTVIITPYANSSTQLFSDEVWFGLVNKLKALGYIVYTNVAGKELPIKGTMRIKLTFPELVYAAGKVKCFIGRRSGIFDLLCFTDAELLCILYVDYWHDDLRKNFPDKKSYAFYYAGHYKAVLENARKRNADDLTQVQLNVPHVDASEIYFEEDMMTDAIINTVKELE